MATWDGDGNNSPIVALAGALATRGDEVVIFGHETTRGRFEREGCTFVEWTSTSQPRNSREFIPAAEEMAYVVEHVIYCSAYQADLRQAIEELAPDVVMVDVSLKYALVEGLRSRTLLWVLCHVVYALVAGDGDDGDAYFAELARAAAREGVPAFRSDREIMDMADGVVVFSYAGFDPLHGGDPGPNVVHVGPLRAGSRSSGWERRSPDKQLVLVSLSTSDMNQAALLQRLCDACGQLDVEALVTTGPSLPSGTLTAAANVTAVDFVDHDDVSPHADLVVTHAGLGTVMAALTYGVPMVCTPLGRDQGFNAERVAQLGLGMTIEPEATTDELRHAIQNMLDDGDAKQRASEFRESVSTHPGIDAALQAIDRTISPT